MGIFRREQSDVQQPSAAPSAETGAQWGAHEQQATLAPPAGAAPQVATAPGVVPPAASPIYSTRPPESSMRFEFDAETAEKVRSAREARQRAQDSLQGTLRVDVQRTRTSAAAGSGVRRRQAPAPVHVPRPHHRTSFDAVRAAQTGLLNLAWSWQAAGAPIRAIHTYLQVLQRYPDTAAADAAVADLVELSEKLAHAGQFHIALGIYDELEELLACES